MRRARSIKRPSGGFRAREAQNRFGGRAAAALFLTVVDGHLKLGRLINLHLNRPSRQTRSGVALGLLMVAAVVAVWLRNRDILRDLYDYATLIGAAGKTEAGLRPYTDVRSPMQTSVYYFNWLSERIFGATYLGLSWGGLVQALGGGGLIGALLWRRIGPVPAVWFAGAVMLAGCIQHMGFFYNPIGIVCFGIVMVGLARGGCLWPWRSGVAWLVCVALFIGGTNKLNFHGLTLAGGGLLVLRSWLAGEITLRAFFGHALVMTLAGVVAPLMFELAWTGATLAEWWREVVVQPTARFEAAKHFMDLRIFLQPANDYHHHILFRPLGGVGLGLLLLVGGWALWSRRRQGARWPELICGLGVLAGCVVGSALLMVTNYETVVLTSLAFLLSALAMYLFAREDEGSAGQHRIRRLLLAGAVLWTLDGGYAAWHGSRLLYAQDPPPRSAYERLSNAPKPLAYFEGVRFLNTELKAMRLLAAKLEAMEEADGSMRGVLFGPAVEWLERAYPEAMVRHMPIWYHYGTSLATDDLDWFRAQLAAAGVTRVVVNPSWEIWPPAIAQWLRDDFQTEAVSERHAIYHPRRPELAMDSGEKTMPVARTFHDELISNVLITATDFDRTAVLQTLPDGATLFGATSSWRWDWPLGARDFTGTAVAVAQGAASGGVVFRVLCGSGETETLLWEMPLRVGPGQPEVRRTFILRSDGRPLRLETRVEGEATAGWREMRISLTGLSDEPVGLPLLVGLRSVHPFAWTDGKYPELWFAKPTPSTAVGPVVPFETWRKLPPGIWQAKVSAQFAANENNPADPVVVALMWYHAGRYEIMSERMIDLRATRAVELAANLPESGGWVGFVARPAGGEGAGHHGVEVKWEP